MLRENGVRGGGNVELYYDLHIHSCLSSCGDGDMTPANIVGMAAVKGLDVIAVTDHNSCKNCGAAMAMGEEYGVLVIPGMEICTAEEVHAVCLFPDLPEAMDFDRLVHDALPPVKNRPDIFGDQQIYDCGDHICGEEPYLLINACSISFDGLWELVRERGGVMFPAHIDKTANSLISNLGMVPPDSRFVTAEVKNLSLLHRLRREHPYLERCRIVSNSDAHYLEDINEPQLTLPVEEKSIGSVLETLLKRE